MSDKQASLQVGDLSVRELTECYCLAKEEYSLLLNKHTDVAYNLLTLIETIERELQGEVSKSTLKSQEVDNGIAED